MGKRSTKADKNIYFQIRDDELHLTRETAAEMMPTMSERRLEKIEYGETVPQPEDILEMAEAYKHPDLCNYYCAHECAIGKVSVPEVKVSGLSDIVLKMLSSLNSLQKQKERLVEITEDGEITDDELPDFVKIQEQLEKISITVDALNLWVQNTVSQGKLDKDKLEELRKAKKK